MIKFMVQVSDLVEEEFRMAMLVDDIHMSRLVVFDRQL